MPRENGKRKDIVGAIADCLVRAGSTFPADKKRAYERAIESESNENSKWLLQVLNENAKVAGEDASPLCDDTGIPHVLIEVGPSQAVDGNILAAIQDGIAVGLRRLPGRPMAVRGNGEDRLGQVRGMYDDPAMLEPDARRGTCYSRQKLPGVSSPRRSERREADRRLGQGSLFSTGLHSVHAGGRHRQIALRSGKLDAPGTS